MAVGRDGRATVVRMRWGRRGGARRGSTGIGARASNTISFTFAFPLLAFTFTFPLPLLSLAIAATFAVVHHVPGIGRVGGTRGAEERVHVHDVRARSRTGRRSPAIACWIVHSSARRWPQRWEGMSGATGAASWRDGVVPRRCWIVGGGGCAWRRSLLMMEWWRWWHVENCSHSLDDIGDEKRGVMDGRRRRRRRKGGIRMVKRCAIVIALAHEPFLHLAKGRESSLFSASGRWESANLSENKN